MSNEINLETTTLGGGCFWCIEAVYNELEGVQVAESGYSGGKTDNPTYEKVCSGSTGHAEVVRIRFNPKIISYKEILEIFFTIHDPTTLNQQGNDIGFQYRSVIFYHSEEQKKVAQEIISKLGSSKKWRNPIVTEVSSFDKFYKAADYHQTYFKLNAHNHTVKLLLNQRLTSSENCILAN